MPLPTPSPRGAAPVTTATLPLRRSVISFSSPAMLWLRPMASNDTFEGGCTCRHVRYRMTSKPMFVHCCHCRWCQRETGTAFALNAMIEADRVELTAGEVEVDRHPVGERQGPAHLALPAVQDRGVEQLCRRGRQGPLRARRHARRARCSAARHPHLHHVQAALGHAAAGIPAMRGILQAAGDVAEGSPGTVRGPEGQMNPATPDRLLRIGGKPDRRRARAARPGGSRRFRSARRRSVRRPGQPHARGLSRRQRAGRGGWHRRMLERLRQRGIAGVVLRARAGRDRGRSRRCDPARSR